MKLQIPGYGEIRVDSISEYAGGAVANVQNITTVADVDGSLNNTYFHIYSANDAIGYTVWFNVGSSGTAPKIGNSVNVEVAVTGNDSADTVAGLVQSALNALPSFTASLPSGETALVEVTNGATGSCLPADDPDFTNTQDQKTTATTGFTYTNVTPGAIALPSSLILYRIIGSKLNQYQQWTNPGEYGPVPFKRNSVDIVLTEHQFLIMNVVD